MSEPKLKPCPFCGSNMTDIEVTVRTDRPKCNCIAKVVCLNCFASAMNHGFDWTQKEAKDNAIAAWNRRANDEQADC